MLSGCSGYAYRKLGRWDKAIEDYEASLRLLPDSIKTYNNLGYSFAKGGDFERAIENYAIVSRFAALRCCLIAAALTVNVLCVAGDSVGSPEQSRLSQPRH